MPTTEPAESAPAALDFDLGFGGEAAAEPERGGAASAPAAHAPKAETSAADDGISIDFDLGPDTPAAAAPAPETAAEFAAAPSLESGLMMDFDLGAPAEPAPAEAKAPELDLSAISLDMGTSTTDASGAAAPDAHWQEVATKLDLAKAYEEMGDKDGARELLNEVVAEGDAAQQQQAKTMLEALG